jgi:hypothetical protein
MWWMVALWTNAGAGHRTDFKYLSILWSVHLRSSWIGYIFIVCMHNDVVCSCL